MSGLDIERLTICDARDFLDRGDVSSVELTELFLGRIEKLEGSLDSFVTITSDLAMEQAAIADAIILRGEQEMLTGIPMQLKEEI